MQLFVKGVDGVSQCFNPEPSATLQSLKYQVAQRIALKEDDFTLSTGVQFLYDTELPLSAFALEQDQTLYVNLDLLGGAKKRKKKTYSKPKKIKHKKKKNKLAVLKYYKVDASNKVSRLRRECPNESCGAGVFMANHKDRVYCGRCTTIFIVNTATEEAA